MNIAHSNARTPNTHAAPASKSPRRQHSTPDRLERLPAIGYTRLMEASQARLEEAARAGPPELMLVADRILNSPRDFGSWESEHAYLMRRVALQPNRGQQTLALLTAALALIHRKALFEYLRDFTVTGRDRRKLIAVFHGYGDYVNAVIGEYENFLRSTASHLCTCHVGANVTFAPVFDDPLIGYEQLYTEYFRAYCELTLSSEQDPKIEGRRVRLPHLKAQLALWRRSLFSQTGSSGSWKAPSFEMPATVLATC